MYRYLVTRLGNMTLTSPLVISLMTGGSRLCILNVKLEINTRPVRGHCQWPDINKLVILTLSTWINPTLHSTFYTLHSTLKLDLNQSSAFAKSKPDIFVLMTVLLELLI